nr:uncharacterized protein LOC119716497 isoform X3 [Anas platyrhynchos]
MPLQQNRYLPVWLLACLMPAMVVIYLSPEKERSCSYDMSGRFRPPVSRAADWSWSFSSSQSGLSCGRFLKSMNVLANKLQHSSVSHVASCYRSQECWRASDCMLGAAKDAPQTVPKLVCYPAARDRTLPSVGYWFVHHTAVLLWRCRKSEHVRTGMAMFDTTSEKESGSRSWTI